MTGVQTCALPICNERWRPPDIARGESSGGGVSSQGIEGVVRREFCGVVARRGEEAAGGAGERCEAERGCVISPRTGSIWIAD